VFLMLGCCVSSGVAVFPLARGVQSAAVVAPLDYQIIQEDVKYHGKTEAFEERDRQLEIAAMTVEPPGSE